MCNQPVQLIAGFPVFFVGHGVEESQRDLKEAVLDLRYRP
jgi:hypothetical protein